MRSPVPSRRKQAGKLPGQQPAAGGVVEAARPGSPRFPPASKAARSQRRDGPGGGGGSVPRQWETRRAADAAQRQDGRARAQGGGAAGGACDGRPGALRAVLRRRGSPPAGRGDPAARLASGAHFPGLRRTGRGGLGLCRGGPRPPPPSPALPLAGPRPGGGAAASCQQPLARSRARGGCGALGRAAAAAVGGTCDGSADGRRRRRLRCCCCWPRSVGWRERGRPSGSSAVSPGGAERGGSFIGARASAPSPPPVFRRANEAAARRSVGPERLACPAPQLRNAVGSDRHERRKRGGGARTGADPSPASPSQQQQQGEVCSPGQPPLRHHGGAAHLGDPLSPSPQVVAWQGRPPLPTPACLHWEEQRLEHHQLGREPHLAQPRGSCLGWPCSGVGERLSLETGGGGLAFRS